MFRIENDASTAVNQTMEIGDPDLTLGDDIMKNLYARSAAKALGNNTPFIVKPWGASSVPAVLDATALESRDCGEAITNMLGSNTPSTSQPKLPKGGVKRASNASSSSTIGPEGGAGGKRRGAKVPRTSNIQDISDDGGSARLAISMSMSESEAVAFEMPEADSAFLSTQNEALKALLATKGLCRSADVPADQMVKQISYDRGAKLTEHVKQVRKERRKVSRRAESANKLAVITAIDDHITSCEQAICFFQDNESTKHCDR